MTSGLRTIVTRTVPDRTTFRRSGVTIVAGYVFHIAMFVAFFLYAPHIRSSRTWSA